MPALVAAVVLLALNLRTVIASVPPLLDVIRDDLGLSATVGGLVTTLPVVAFGLLAPLAPRVAARVPLERALVGCALLTAAAAGLRGVGSFAPLLIRVRHSEHTGLLIGAYAMSLNLGAALAAGTSAVLGDALGWPGGLAFWALPALAAAVVWALRPAGPPVPAASPDDAPESPAERRTSWAIACYFGIQSAAFYAGLSWLPTILEADGASPATAGLLQGIASCVGIPLALALPIHAARRGRQTGHLLLVVALAASGFLGLLLVPSVPLVWIVLIGLGQAGALGLGLALPSLRADDPSAIARLTAHSLLIGYSIGALGPWVLGGVHDLAGGWTVPLAVLVAITLAELIPGRRAVVPVAAGLGDAHAPPPQPGR